MQNREERIEYQILVLVFSLSGLRLRGIYRIDPSPTVPETLMMSFSSSGLRRSLEIGGGGSGLLAIGTQPMAAARANGNQAATDAIVVGGPPSTDPSDATAAAVLLLLLLMILRLLLLLLASTPLACGAILALKSITDRYYLKSTQTITDFVLFLPCSLAACNISNMNLFYFMLKIKKMAEIDSCKKKNLNV